MNAGGVPHHAMEGCYCYTDTLFSAIIGTNIIINNLIINIDTLMHYRSLYNPLDEVL